MSEKCVELVKEAEAHAETYVPSDGNDLLGPHQPCEGSPSRIVNGQRTDESI